MAEWYYQRPDGTVIGQLAPADIERHVAQKWICPETLIRKGQGQWFPAWRIKGLLDRKPEDPELIFDSSGMGVRMTPDNMVDAAQEFGKTIGCVLKGIVVVVIGLVGLFLLLAIPGMMIG